nr:putative reverse transcriptase domain-containing protein [Tanacetum cinerariifolium]
ANVVNAQRDNRAIPKGNGCFKCGALRNFKRDCLKLKNKDRGNVNAQGWVYAVRNVEKKGNASRDPDSNVVTGTFLLNNRYASILFDTDADRSFISTAFGSLIDISSKPKTLDETIELANDFMDQKLRTYAERQTNNKRKADDLSRNSYGLQQQPVKRQNVAKVYNIGSGEKNHMG